MESQPKNPEFRINPENFTHVDKNPILMTNGSLMKVVSNAECSLWSILQYF